MIEEGGMTGEGEKRVSNFVLSRSFCLKNTTIFFSHLGFYFCFSVCILTLCDPLSNTRKGVNNNVKFFFCSINAKQSFGIELKFPV